MNLYSDKIVSDIYRYIDTRTWPKPKPLVHLRELDGVLYLTLYRDSFNRYDGEDQLQIAGQMKDILEKVNNDGIPLRFQVAPGDGISG